MREERRKEVQSEYSIKKVAAMSIDWPKLYQKSKVNTGKSNR